MIELPKHHQVFVPGEVLIDGSILASQANMRTERVGVFDDIEPGHLCSPGVGTQERRQDTHGGGIVSLAKGRDSRDQNRARGRPPTTTHPPSGRGAVGLGDRWLPRLPCDCQRSRLGKTCAATADWFALRARWCESIPVRPTGASSRPASAQSHAPALLPLWGRIRATALPNGPTAREPVRHSRPGKSHWLVPATACAPPASLRL